MLNLDLSQVALVEQLLTEAWSGPGTVLLNPEFPNASVPEQYKHVADSVLVTWSFLPLLVSVSAYLGVMDDRDANNWTFIHTLRSVCLTYNVAIISRVS